MRVGGFGLHEALDQIGAVLGLLAVATILASQQRYYINCISELLMREFLI